MYSTCSTLRLENEDVVEEVLNDCPGFQVVEALPWWRNAPLEPGTGRPFPSWAKYCLRSDPITHKCRGFFLCRLDRQTEVGSGVCPVRRSRKRKRPRLLDGCLGQCLMVLVSDLLRGVARKVGS